MPLSVLYAVKDSNSVSVMNMNYILELVFGSSGQKLYLGRVWMWNIPKMIAKKGQSCSLMVVQVHESLRNLLRPSKWFYIPLSVSGEVDIPIDQSVMKKHTVKTDLRKIRDNSLGFEVAQDPQQFDDFYYNMYTPYITEAHSANAFILPYEEMRAEFKNCDLLLITKQEKRIAGSLIVYEETGPRLWAPGNRDSNRHYLKDGARGALYHFSFLFLKEKGYTTVNLGRSKAFLRDGVLQYKRKWSQRIVATSPYVYALKIISFTNGAKAFLQQNPFIFENGGTLNGAVFVDEEKALTSKDFVKIDKQFFNPGLSKLYIYCFHDIEEIKQASIPPELSDRVELRSAGDMA